MIRAGGILQNAILMTLKKLSAGLLVLLCLTLGAATTARAQTPTAQQQEARLWDLAVEAGRKGQTTQALAQMERLVSLRPDAARYHYELGILLAQLGQDDRARYHLELVRGGDLPPEIRAEVIRRVQAIDQRRPWDGYLRFGLVQESNPARRTAAESLQIGGLSFTINPAARAQSARGLNLGVGATAQNALNARLNLQGGLHADATFYDGDAPDDVQLRGSVTLQYFGNAGRQSGLGLALTPRWLDGEAYAKTLQIFATHSRPLTQSGTLDVMLRRGRIDYAQPGVAPLDQSEVQLTYRHAASPRLAFHGGLSAERRSSAAAWESGRIFGLSAGGTYAFEGGVVAGLDLNALSRRHDSPHPLFGKIREDHLVVAGLRLLNRDWSWRGMTPVLSLAWEKQTSTLAYYSYDNLRMGLTLTKRF